MCYWARKAAILSRLAQEYLVFTGTDCNVSLRAVWGFRQAASERHVVPILTAGTRLQLTNSRRATSLVRITLNWIFLSSSAWCTSAAPPRQKECITRFLLAMCKNATGCHARPMLHDTRVTPPVSHARYLLVACIRTNDPRMAVPRCGPLHIAPAGDRAGRYGLPPRHLFRRPPQPALSPSGTCSSTRRGSELLDEAGEGAECSRVGPAAFAFRSLIALAGSTSSDFGG